MYCTIKCTTTTDIAYTINIASVHELHYIVVRFAWSRSACSVLYPTTWKNQDDIYTTHLVSSTITLISLSKTAWRNWQSVPTPHRVKQRRERTVTGRAAATATRHTSYTSPSTISGKWAARFNLPSVSGRLSPLSPLGRWNEYQLTRDWGETSSDCVVDD